MPIYGRNIWICLFKIIIHGIKSGKCRFLTDYSRIKYKAGTQHTNIIAQNKDDSLMYYQRLTPLLVPADNRIREIYASTTVLQNRLLRNLGNYLIEKQILSLN